MSQCAICGGDIEKGLIIFTANLDSGILVVKNVPANICTQCGEKWIPADMAKKLERIANDARAKRPELEIVRFEEAA